MNCSGGADCCWLTCLITLAVWILVASFLLQLSWNKVVTTLSSMKSLSFKQSLIVVATLLVFFGPCLMKKGSCGKSSCSKSTSSCAIKGKKAGCGCSKSGKATKCGCKKKCSCSIERGANKDG